MVPYSNGTYQSDSFVEVLSVACIGAWFCTVLPTVCLYDIELD